MATVLERAQLLDKRLALGLSGGLDSMVLLDLLAHLRLQHPLRLTAIHINHGISPNAARWAQLCVTRCAGYAIQCTVVTADIVRTGGEGLEAAARAARYAVFMQQDVDAIVLAHHLDDQAETLMLQLLRGAGPRGLAAMPETRRLARESPVLLLRPLLEVARANLAAYARRRRLQWVDDESNASLDFDRNWLRHDVLPRIAMRFPAYRDTWLRASRNLADASELGDVLARIDAAEITAGEGLRVAKLLELGEVRARNVLRWFLDRNGVRPPSRDHLNEALRQLVAPRGDAQPLVELGPVSLRRHRGVVRLVEQTAPARRDWRAVWRGEPVLHLPEGMGALYFERTIGAGLSAARLSAGAVSVALRAGGERMKPAHERPTRTLKNLLREAAVPAWQREQLPLLFCSDAPVWVPGIGHDCRFAAGPHEPGVLVSWQRGQVYTL